MVFGTSTPHVMDMCPGTGHGRVDHIKRRHPQLLVSPLAWQKFVKVVNLEGVSGCGKYPVVRIRKQLSSM